MEPSTSLPPSSSKPTFKLVDKLPSDLYIMLVANYLDAPSQVCLALTAKHHMSLITGLLSLPLAQICPKLRPEKRQRRIEGDDLEEYEQLMKNLSTWMPPHMLYVGREGLDYREEYSVRILIPKHSHCYQIDIKKQLLLDLDRRSALIHEPWNKL
jgi:hypothetical protein